MNDMQKIQFNRSGLFYRMVMSYIAAICGMLVFRPELRFDQSVKVGLALTEYPALTMIPLEVKEMFAKGDFNLRDVADSLAFMLINAAYQATADRYGDEQWRVLREEHPELEFFRHPPKCRISRWQLELSPQRADSASVMARSSANKSPAGHANLCFQTQARRLFSTSCRCGKAPAIDSPRTLVGRMRFTSKQLTFP